MGFRVKCNYEKTSTTTVEALRIQNQWLLLAVQNRQASTKERTNIVYAGANVEENIVSATFCFGLEHQIG